MAKKISTHDAKTHLSRVIEEVLAGGEVIVCRGDIPVVRIVKYEASKKSPELRKVGVKTSPPVTYTEDCFAPLQDSELDAWGMK